MLPVFLAVDKSIDTGVGLDSFIIPINPAAALSRGAFTEITAFINKNGIGSLNLATVYKWWILAISFLTSLQKTTGNFVGKMSSRRWLGSYLNSKTRAIKLLSSRNAKSTLARLSLNGIG